MVGHEKGFQGGFLRGWGGGGGRGGVIYTVTRAAVP